ncbi:MAG TPA: hypothetical protein VGJ59_01745 [Jatrophihabitantaceae bacterium]|jgi:hypothetical protein
MCDQEHFAAGHGLAPCGVRMCRPSLKFGGEATAILATLERQSGLALLGTRDKQVVDLGHASIVGGNR